MRKGRTILWILFGLAFAVTLAIVVGQRLSAQGMAVVIGVLAGVATSIPTSLVVVWFVGRAHIGAAAVRFPAEAPAYPAASPEPAPASEPRIIVMTPPYQDPTGYPQRPAALNNYAQPAGYAPGGYPPPAALPPRRFTVVGGTELSADMDLEEDETTWER